MSDTLQSAFHLERRPFAKDVPCEHLWLDDTRTLAIDRMLDAVTCHKHVLVEGEPGCGKTTVLRALQSRLSPVHFRPVYVSHVTLGPRDFYRLLALALGVEAKATAAALFAAVQAEIQSLHREHRQHPVLVLDECHLMPDTTLGHLHVLANFGWDALPLLSLVLVGLPELHDRLRLGIHRSLLSRISLCVELKPTSPDQTAAYVRQRVAAAGGRAELFAPDALAVLHELTGGLLRSVDTVAEAALALAAERDLKLVDRELVVRAWHLTPLA